MNQNSLFLQAQDDHELDDQILSRSDLPVICGDDQIVWNEIRRHRGKDAIISAADLSLKLGLSERNIRTAINNLRNIHKKMIGSSCGKPSGYYLAVASGEVEECIAFFHNVGIQNLKISYGMLKICKRDFIDHITLNLEEQLT